MLRVGELRRMLTGRGTMKMTDAEVLKTFEPPSTCVIPTKPNLHQKCVNLAQHHKNHPSPQVCPPNKCLPPPLGACSGCVVEEAGVGCYHMQMLWITFKGG